MYYMTPNSTSPGCYGQYKVSIDMDIDQAGNQLYLVDRGYCSFARKVRKAQIEGAEAVIIVNNECLQSDYDFIKQHHETKLKQDHKTAEKAALDFCCKDLRPSSPFCG